MNSNAWIILENNLALSWWQYYQWWLSDPDNRGPEPSLSEWDKKAIRKLIDINHNFRAFKKASFLGLEWRMLSVWNVTENQANAGYAQHGDAEQGGNYAVAGFWTWSTKNDPLCPISDSYNWRPTQVIQFMPDECVPPDCETQQPATSISDVVLLHRQPPKEFPETTVLVQ